MRFGTHEHHPAGFAAVAQGDGGLSAGLACADDDDAARS
jgi:hypothetical protein